MHKMMTNSDLYRTIMYMDVNKCRTCLKYLAAVTIIK